MYEVTDGKGSHRCGGSRKNTVATGASGDHDIFEGDDPENDPTRKYFGGGMQKPKPTPTPTPSPRSDVSRGTPVVPPVATPGVIGNPTTYAKGDILGGSAGSGALAGPGGSEFKQNVAEVPNPQRVDTPGYQEKFAPAPAAAPPPPPPPARKEEET
jgi:hypothetical protein